MLKRKITQTLIDWKNEENKQSIKKISINILVKI